MQIKKTLLCCLFFSLFLACSILKTPEEREAEYNQQALERAKLVQENMFHGTLIEIQCRLSSGEMMTKGRTDGMLAGAAAGWLIMGKSGAVLGAMAGSEQSQVETRLPGKIESLVFNVADKAGVKYTFEIVELNHYKSNLPYARTGDVSKDVLANMEIGSKIKIPSSTKLSRLAKIDSRFIFYEEEQIPGL